MINFYLMLLYNAVLPGDPYTSTSHSASGSALIEICLILIILPIAPGRQGIRLVSPVRTADINTEQMALASAGASVITSITI